MKMDDNDLILFAQGKLSETNKVREILARLQKDPGFVEEHLFLLGLSAREEKIFGALENFPEKSKHPDFVIYYANSPSLLNIIPFRQDIEIHEKELMARNTDRLCYRAISINTKGFAHIHLMETEEPDKRWALFLDKDLASLEVLEGERILYKSSYKKKQLLSLGTSSCSYQITINRKYKLLFYLVKKNNKDGK